MCWPGRSVAADSPENPPIRRVDLSATRDPPGTGPVLETRDRTGRFFQLRKAGNRSFCSEGPKGRSRKERCSSGLNDPARPSPPTRRPGPFQPLPVPEKAVGRQSTYSKLAIPGQTFELFSLAHSTKGGPDRVIPFSSADSTKAAPPGCPSPCARTSLPSGCAASTQPGTSVPCICLCLSHVASQRVLERGVLFCRYLYRQDGPPPPPTRAPGSRPSLDRFAVSRAVSGDQRRTALRAIRAPPIVRTRCTSTRLSAL